ncbi:NUDIX hydrolase [Candidatus Poribacteria bacterium]|jgi:8-oxo-dGTP pyrophosphatase MutT (NUDIX family)|nr:NUDIX hydrolase [Candidatus Poribacteria bacterium]MBT5536473.1 NUDIX hydrolase [Candidatus Poribacteria bacterium]MBT5711526.1 NUDIX hydrolase [Candidatus Poribacteria bacterium]MBT7096940.1 NUDIX hydrolase [Candidatus Poribacteria bacterium]MBT7806713.1 NUDIX hydrolase [Candidatus Poribacteria bacterium]
MSAGRPKRLKRDTLYESDWLSLHRDRVELPSGTILEQYHVLDFPRECVAAVVENADGDILLIRIHRYPVDREHWEIPAGRIEDDDDILGAAAREVLEETGYTSTDHRHVYTYYPSVGISNQVFHVVFCKARDLVGTPDEDEVAAARWASPAEVRGLIRRGDMKDGYSFTALLLLFSDVLGEVDAGI